jgi:hypothetical protein
MQSLTILYAFGGSKLASKDFFECIILYILPFRQIIRTLEYQIMILGIKDKQSEFYPFLREVINTSSVRISRLSKLLLD